MVLRVLAFLFAALAVACGDGDRDTTDASTPLDSGMDDGSADSGPDADEPDTSLPDSSTTDAGPDADATVDLCADVDCSELDDQCNDGVCDGETGDCSAAPKADDTACGDETSSECDAADSCLAGECVPNLADEGTACGDQGIACTVDDSCDGSGICTDNGFMGEGTECGDDSDTECTNPDTCDAAGSCLPNHEDNGAACGDQGVACTVDDACDGSGICTDNGFMGEGTECGDNADTECTNPDTCDAAGSCLSNHEGNGTACGDQGVVCTVDDSCDGSGICTDNGFMGEGTECGDDSDTECTNPDTCDAAGSCLSNHEDNGAACGDQGVECANDDACDGSGACTDNGFDGGATCGSDPGMRCETDGACMLPSSCAQLHGREPALGSGAYPIDPDGDGPAAPVLVSCDMATDGGGWTLVFHVFDLNNNGAGGTEELDEADFDAAFGHNTFTEETWNYDRIDNSISAGLPAGLVTVTTQGAIDVGAFGDNWNDIRMTCALGDATAAPDHFVQIDGYTTVNGNQHLHGSATNGTSYVVPAGSNSFGQTTVWHDNEPNTGNLGSFMCDGSETATASAQFGFCYTDFLNDVSGELGDSIVSIAFGAREGSLADPWSPGFTAECGDMDDTAQHNAGTYSIWIR